MAFAIAHGVAEDKIILDPGIGFGKTVAHNLALLQRLPELVALGRPVMVGTSRKSFIGKLTGREIEGRTPGTLATNVIAYERGARLFRVHDVGPTLDALTVTAATLAG
jgi:dihydropteroate synthase